MSSNEFTSRAPGRVCLFGEHQDYLGLPVVAFALPELDVRIRVVVSPHTAAAAQRSDGNGRVLSLRVPSLGRFNCYDLDDLPPRQGRDTSTPDFALAAIHEVLDEGWHFAHGAECVSESLMPMQAGLSSSSAFCVAWVQVLSVLAGKSLSPLEIAILAHRAEVVHFDHHGGTMDHITCCLGGLLRIGPSMWQFETLPIVPSDRLGVWVLAYSGEPKETLRHLKRCKTSRLRLLSKLGGDWDASANGLDDTEKVLLQATHTNRDTEARAVEIWMSSVAANAESLSPAVETGLKLGELVNLHHEALRDGLHLSTPTLEAMREAATSAGAWGYKLVGSGGGGCAVAWVPENKASEVELAMRRVNPNQILTWIIREFGEGASIHRGDDG